MSELLFATNRKIEAKIANDKGIPMDEAIELEKWAYRVVANLRTARNSYSAINRIPDECLAAIFRIAALECHASVHGAWESPYDWTSLGLVCRHWYTTTRGFPALWSIIDSSCPDFARDALVRSKAARLDMRLGSSCSESFIKSLVPHLGRTRTLQSTMAFTEQALLLSGLEDAPVLKHLAIEIFPSNVDYHTSPSLFERNGATLTHLMFSGCSLRDSIHKLTNLVHLEICNDQNSSSITLSALLDVLSSNPLQIFRLRCAGPRSHDQTPTTRIVRLPHIQDLTLFSTASKLLLEHISLPRGCDLTVRDSTVSNPTDIPILANYLPRSIDHLKNLHGITRLRYWFHGTRAIYGVGPNGSLTIDGLQPHDFRSGLAPLDLTHVDEFWIERLTFPDDYIHPQGAGWSVCERLERVFVVSCSFGATYLKALLQEDGTLLLPNLRNFTVYVGEEEYQAKAEWLEALKLRAARGCRLERFSMITHWDVPADEAELAELGEHVGEFSFERGSPAPNCPFKKSNNEQDGLFIRRN